MVYGLRRVLCKSEPTAVLVTEDIALVIAGRLIEAAFALIATAIIISRTVTLARTVPRGAANLLLLSSWAASGCIRQDKWDHHGRDASRQMDAPTQKTAPRLPGSGRHGVRESSDLLKHVLLPSHRHLVTN